MDKRHRQLRTLPAGRYDAFELGPPGGMGIVYFALDTDLNRRVALKIVNPAAADDTTRDRDTPVSPAGAMRPERGTPASEAYDELQARFLQEAWVTGAMEHPNIVPVHEVGQTANGIPYYTMRFVRGRRTLKHAIMEAQGRSVEARIALLDPFLKLCDAVSYAHANGVVHRDLKPDNVALGDHGEVVLLDWGLAKIKGRDDLTGSLWQEKIHAFREAADLRTLGGALGTPGYMSPEAAQGRVDEVGARSDVYSLGAILFEMLTGRPPVLWPGNFSDYVTALTTQEAPAATTVEPAVPDSLSDLCARCLLSDKNGRPESASALAEAIRDWQVQRAVDLEVEGLLRDARTALESADELSGEARLRQADRAAASLAGVVARRPDEKRVAPHEQRIAALREEGVRERERASGRRLLLRVGIVALVLTTVAGFVVAAAIEAKRKELADTHARVLRLSDAKKVGDLLAHADRLWPLHPDRAPDMRAWIKRTTAVLESRSEHEDTLADLRMKALPYTEADRLRDHAPLLRRIERLRAARSIAIREREALDQGEKIKRGALTRRIGRLDRMISTVEARVRQRAVWHFVSDQDAWRHHVLTKLVADFERLVPKDGKVGAVAEIMRRLDFVTTLREWSIDDHQDAWDRTIAAIRESPKYGGLEISPQLGLVPLGPDPDSGLFEFAHVGSGELPARDVETMRLDQRPDTAIVLVLIPGGTFRMGAQRTDPTGVNYDPAADSTESDERSRPIEVTLSPYFISKYECTQAQWRAMTKGREPSRYKAGQRLAGRMTTLRNPVEQVSWEHCKGNPGWLVRHGLTLPTEAQWEHACRAGTSTPWFTGHDVANLSRAGNVADSTLKRHEPAAAVTPAVDDGYGMHAPVGSLAPNGFGLHDVHGNVWEWCWDAYRDGGYSEGLRTDPVTVGTGQRRVRGGAWNAGARFARSANRRFYKSDFFAGNLGCRPARQLDP